MSKTVTPPKGKVHNITFQVEKWEEMVRRRDERTARNALTDDTSKAILMDMCPAELERHLMRNSDMFDMYPKVGPAIRAYVEQFPHKRRPDGRRRDGLVRGP